MSSNPSRSFGLNVLTSSISASIQVLLSVVATLVLGRQLGAAAYGVFSHAQATLRSFAPVATLGMGGQLLRESVKESGTIPVSRQQALRTCRRAAGFASLVAVVVAALLAFAVDAPRVHLVMILGLPLLAVASVRTATLRVNHRVLQAHLPEQLVHPVLFLALLTALWTFDQWSPIAVAACFLLSLLTSSVIGLMLLTGIEASPAASAGALVSIRPSALLTASSTLLALRRNLDLLLLGWLSTPDQVGVFGIANRFAGLVGLALLATQRAATPLIRQALSEPVGPDVAAIMIRAAKWGGGLALAASMLLLAAAAPLTTLLGDEYSSARGCLWILLVGQLCHCTAGPVGLVLTMSGDHREHLLGAGVAILVGLLLHLALSPPLGAAGAAIAASASLIALNATHLARVRHLIQSAAGGANDPRLGPTEPTP